MAEPVRLEIQVDNAGQPILDRVAQTLRQEFPLSAQTATQAFELYNQRLVSSYDNLRGLDTLVQQGNTLFRQWGVGVTESGQIVDRFGRQVQAATGDALRQLAGQLGEAEQRATTLRGILPGVGGAVDNVGGTIFKTVASFLGLHSALSVAQHLFSAGIESALSYQDALTKINATIPGQTALQAQLRDELGKLPALYGSATELAVGLQRVLSFGFTDPVKALEVLRTASELNIAGFGDLDTTTKLLIHTQAVYGDQVKDLGHVSDTYTDAIQRSGANLKEFGRSFPVVLEAAKQLGVSFEDTVAAFTFLNPLLKDVGRTSFSLDQIFRGLAKSQDELAARGVDVTRTLSEQGLAGVLRRVDELTHGNARALQELVPNMRNIEAILALVRDGWEKLEASEREHRDNTGKTKAAIGERQASLALLWETTKNAASQGVASTVGFIDALLQAHTKATQMEIQNAQLQSEAFLSLIKPVREWRDETLRATASQEVLAKGLVETNPAVEGLRVGFQKSQEGIALWQRAVDEMRQHVEQLPPTLGEAQKALAELDAGLKELGSRKLFSTDELNTIVTTLTSNLGILARSADIPFVELQAAADRAFKAVSARTKDFSTEFLDTLGSIAKRAPATLDELLRPWTVFGDRTRSELRFTAEEALKSFNLISRDGERTAGELLRHFQDDIKKIREGEFTTLPDGLNDALNRMNEIARARGDEPFKIIRDKSGVIRDIVQGAPDAIRKTLNEVIAVEEQFGANWIDHLSKTQLQSAYDFGLISKSAYDAAQGIKQSFEQAQEALNAYGNSLVRLSDETQRLNNLRIQSDMKFAQDKQGLLRQEEQITKELLNLQITPPPIDAPGFREASIKTLQQELDIIRDKLKTLGFDTFGAPLPAPPQPNGGAALLPPTSPAPPGGGTAPSSSSGTPSLGGGTFRPAAPPQTGTLRNPDVTTIRVDTPIQIAVNAGMVLSRIDEQELVRRLTPALNEALDRLQIQVRRLVVR